MLIMCQNRMSRTLVEEGGEELVKQPAVARMQHDHAETTVLGIRGGLNELFDDLLNLLLGHGAAQDLGIEGGAAIAGSNSRICPAMR